MKLESLALNSSVLEMKPPELILVEVAGCIEEYVLHLLGPKDWKGQVKALLERYPQGTSARLTGHYSSGKIQLCEGRLNGGHPARRL